MFCLVIKLGSINLTLVLFKQIGYPCDVWSIGCTLFELFTGETLFKVDTVQELFRMIHLMIGPFTQHEIKRINLKLSEGDKKKTVVQKLSKDEKNVDFLKEPEFVYIKGEVKKIESYFDKNDAGEKDLFELIVRMLNPDPVTRVKLEELI